MKNQGMTERFSGVGKYTTPARSMGKKAIRVAGLALPLFVILSISGCSGIASTPKTSSSQQTTPGATTISVAPASISFGSVAVGGTASQSVTITNGGGSNLTVTQASATA